jgi:hypothetical protein
LPAGYLVLAPNSDSPDKPGRWLNAGEVPGCRFAKFCRQRQKLCRLTWKKTNLNPIQQSAYAFAGRFQQSLFARPQIKEGGFFLAAFERCKKRVLARGKEPFDQGVTIFNFANSLDIDADRSTHSEPEQSEVFAVPEIEANAGRRILRCKGWFAVWSEDEAYPGRMNSEKRT